MPESRPFTAGEKLECIRRELTYRRRVFPRRVEKKFMSQKTADHQIALMEAIEADYEALEKGERLI